MATSSSFEKFKAVWRKPVVRMLVVPLVILIAGVVQYRLAKVPLPVETSDTKKVGVPPIRLGDKLILNGLEVAPQKRLLFSYQGDPKETVDARFEQGTVTGESRSLYRLNQKFESPAPMSYTTYRPGESKRVCTTGIEAIPLQDNAPSSIALSQSEGPGNQIFRNLAVKFDRDVLINVATTPPPDAPEEAAEDGPGCTKLLAGGAKNLLEGGTLLKAKLERDANLAFRFLPLNPGAPVWSGHDGAFEPLRFTSPVFQARTITIADSRGVTLFEATSSSDQSLRVNKLKIGSDLLQTELSGTGFVKINGELITLSLFDRIKEYPIFAAMFMTLNGVIAAWLLTLIRSLFQREPAVETPTPEKMPPPKQKKRKR